MRAVVVERFGEPAEVVQVGEVPTPTRPDGMARVRMLLCPINPSDLMTIRGIYGRKPTLPFTPGYEGVGIVEEASGLIAWVRGLKGKRVAVLNALGGNWAEQVVIPTRQCVPLPDDLSDEQGASFFVNPATVIVMVRYVLKVPRGAWLLQTAAGSALGRMILRLSKRDGFKTINLVRRREAVAELKALGADEVLVAGEDDIPARVRALTPQTGGVGYALDCVGGSMGSEAVACLGTGGRLLLYGTLSNEPLRIPSRGLMVGRKSIEGFWLADWVKTQGPWAMLSLFRQITSLMREGILTTDVGATYSLDQIGQAVVEAEKVGRGGKVMLQVTERAVS
jgi:NADPH:quinone reductase-like Zn-dependent oxidoreductase